jgi:hypothetical protein
MTQQKKIRAGLVALAVMAVVLANVLIASANPGSFTFSASAFGRVDSTGQATVIGQVTCETPGSVATIYGLMTQSNQQTNASGSFVTSAPCGPTATTWTASFRSVTGPFTTGHASLSVNAFACHFDGYIFRCSSTVTINSLAVTLSRR